MNLEVTFANSAQREFYYAIARNQCFSGGFNNGKTYSGCLKALTLLTTFPNYRMAIARQVRADLMRTTYQTFFKLCPSELIESNNQQEGFTTFKNHSMIYWMHLDKVDENSLRGLEVNSILVDQAEESEEKVYDVLDARIGRWDNAEIPNKLLSRFQDWPKNNRTSKPIAPSYLMLLCNPDTQYHYIYRKYHPQSLEKRSKYFFVEGEWDSSLGSSESYVSALEKGGEYVEKYVKGQWGISNAQIHRLHSDSLLNFSEELLDKIKKKGNLFRILDHGDASPTCVLWFVAIDGVYICYREYYVPNQVISFHRKAINELSTGETYSANYADPQIFKKTAQKQGGFWTVANEYMDSSIGDSKSLAWVPADNNEFATRNRLNELLGKRQKSFLTDSGPAIFFIKKSDEYANGCFHAINELQSQRRKLLGYVDGSAQYCDDREESVADHAYDCIRYFVAMHGSARNEPKRPTKPNTFNYFKMMKGRKENRLEAMSA
jgi:hypothetical protein